MLLLKIFVFNLFASHMTLMNKLEFAKPVGSFQDYAIALLSSEETMLQILCKDVHLG